MGFEGQCIYLCTCDVAKFSELILKHFFSKCVLQVFDVQVHTLIARDALLTLLLFLACELSLTLCLFLSSVTVNMPSIDYGVVQFTDGLNDNKMNEYTQLRVLLWRHLRDF